MVLIGEWFFWYQHIPILSCYWHYLWRRRNGFYLPGAIFSKSVNMKWWSWQMSSSLIYLAACVNIQQGSKVWEKNKNSIFVQVIPGEKHLHTSLPGHSVEEENCVVLWIAEEKNHSVLFSAWQWPITGMPHIPQHTVINNSHLTNASSELGLKC